MFFFFKQKPAYDVRISDWSSDVCSSDLPLESLRRATHSHETMQLNRLFFALWPSASVRRACHDAARELKVKLQPAGYASVPDRYHITMLFLGDQVSSRSEEHTSELQSLMRISYAVFCLKKKTDK